MYAHENLADELGGDDSGAEDYGETTESCKICAELKLKGAHQLSPP